jgi:isopropylmalate/homocitrate/citramalate synthase
MDPSWVGNTEGTQIVLGKLSGRAGFAARAAALGFSLSGVQLQHAFEGFQAIADRGTLVEDRDVERLCHSAVNL